MDFSQIKYEVSQQVALITLNRPDKLNAFTPVMREELKQAIGQADQDDGVRALVVAPARAGPSALAPISPAAARPLTAGAPTALPPAWPSTATAAARSPWPCTPAASR